MTLYEGFPILSPRDVVSEGLLCAYATRGNSAIESAAMSVLIFNPPQRGTESQPVRQRALLAAIITLGSPGHKAPVQSEPSLHEESRSSL